MSIIWTDPPLEMRTATPQGDYSIGCISIREDGSEGLSCIFRAPDLLSAQGRLKEILDEGDMGRIYDKEGSPV